ncbi:sensor histidine kinase [Desulfoferrobacter suflitae]|uniref:sensor histidine kinase n=1 Tax=Desulfoferrobacter suflitae TaxID=2865782 RepID=UPI0021645A71|nr:PAS domain-containing sensor histidine kinase [Desulfoferrobacter suflitae]MCK8601563.1 ATP-binding protein [Desulfoferrobacter suflitae]
MDSQTDFYKSLTRNMMLLIALVSFTPLVLVSGILGYEFHTSYQEKVIAHLQELVQKQRQNIDVFLTEKLANIRVLAETFSYQQLQDELFLKRKLALFQENYGGAFVDLGLVDQNGIQMSYAGPFQLMKANYSQAQWFKEAMENPYFISDVFLGLRGLPHFIVAVQKESHGMKYILRSTIDFVAFNDLVENIHIGKTGLAFIVNQKGEFQTKPRLEAPMNKEFFQSLMTNVHKQFLAVGEAIVEVSDHQWRSYQSEGEVTIVRALDNAGVPFLYVMTPLKNGDWFLVYQQEERDAFADLYRARKIALTIILLGGLAIIFTSYVLSRRMVRHFAQAEREKEMMNEQVIEAGKLASVGELAAGIAHEINNPVAIMVEEAGWIEDLLDEEDLRESENLQEFQRALKQIKTQGVRCKEITHKLLSFARKTDPKLKMVSLNDLINEVVGLSEQSAKYSNVKIVKHLTPDIPVISVSPSEMQQVLLNLINNAIDAMDSKGGTLEITTRMEQDMVVIDVADTGQGIPKANLQKIFDPFYTTKPVGKGTGLGLSICYGIIKKMGGEITVNSAVGIGTTFHVMLPAPEEETVGEEDL